MGKLKEFFNNFLGTDVEEEIEKIDIKDNTAAIEASLEYEGNNNSFKKGLRKKVDLPEINEDTLNKMREYNTKNNNNNKEKEIGE